MSFRSINPANGNTLRVIDAFTPAQLESALQAASAASIAWRRVAIDERSDLLPWTSETRHDSPRRPKACVNYRNPPPPQKG